MPIGFWAVSRRDVTELFEFLYHKIPSIQELNYIIHFMPSYLDDALQDLIKREHDQYTVKHKEKS